MASIEKTIDKEKQITIYTVTGEFLFDQIIDVVNQFYLSEFTLNIIFDLTKADMSEIKSHHMEKIIENGNKYSYLREGGKTAFVLSDDLGYGLGRMYEAFCEIKDHPVAHYVSRNIDEAMIWVMK